VFLNILVNPEYKISTAETPKPSETELIEMRLNRIDEVNKI